MFSLIGLLVVAVAVLGGFAMTGGRLQVLMQPNELVVIGGACLGTLIISAVGNVRGQLVQTVMKAFGGGVPAREDYLDLMKLLYEIFSFMRRNGAVALDEHIADVRKSSIFRKYHSFLRNERAVEFLVDAFKQVVNGTASAEELEVMLEQELETHHEEHAIPIGLLKTAGDALPGLGIVAAVLGIVTTMGKLDASPEEIGHNVAAALVGTFLGILLSYGLVQPLATNAELQELIGSRYLRCIKEGIVASLRGAAPVVAIEFARKAIFAADRPSSDDTERACKAVKAATT
ncbi:MAG: flagellar motor stator protein MotA [Candidatus Binatia bacterium]